MKVQTVAVRVKLNPEMGGWTWWEPHSGQKSDKPFSGADAAAADAREKLDSGGKGTMDLDVSTPITRWYVIHNASYIY